VWERFRALRGMDVDETATTLLPAVLHSPSTLTRTARRSGDARHQRVAAVVEAELERGRRARVPEPVARALEGPGQEVARGTGIVLHPQRASGGHGAVGARCVGAGRGAGGGAPPGGPGEPPPP